MPADGCGCDGPRCELAENDPKHGDPRAYDVNQCRCERCRAGWAAHMGPIMRERRKAGRA